MAYLAAWDAGTTLGDDTRDRVRASSALGIVTAPGENLTDYARGGAAAEAVWILAQQRGLAVQPISPMFVHAREDSDLRTLSRSSPPPWATYRDNSPMSSGLRPDDVPVIVLRFTQAPAASVRSRRSEGRIRSRLVTLMTQANSPGRSGPPRDVRCHPADGRQRRKRREGLPARARRPGRGVRDGPQLPAAQRPRRARVPVSSPSGRPDRTSPTRTRSRSSTSPTPIRCSPSPRPPRRPW